MKPRTIVLSVIVLLIIALYYMVVAAQGGIIDLPSRGMVGGAGQEKHAIAWFFEEVGENPETGAQRTKVSLVWDGNTYDAGTYEGTCAEIGSPHSVPLLNGEVSGVLCWFGGRGDEIGVFRERGGYMLRRGVHEEPVLPDLPNGFRGDFEVIRPLSS